MAVKLFFCYAREDEELLKKLKAHLKPLEREELIEIWYDQDISAGMEWEKTIDEHLNTAQIILLLVSPDFMNSDYCYSTEMKRAIERHVAEKARVIPIILRPVDWKHSPLGKLQALPKDGKPVTRWLNEDEAFFNVVEGIRKVAMQLTARMSAAPLEFTRDGSKEGQMPSVQQPPTPVGPVRPTQWKSLSQYGAALLIVLALLVIGSRIYNSAKGNSAHMRITATATYDSFVATHGIMFGFDAAHTNFNPYERILTPANVSRLTQAWTSPKEGIIDSSPVVTNGVIYIGSDDWNFYALDARTGSLLWFSQTGGSIPSSPAVANGVVYVGSEDHKLYAFKVGGCGQSICSPLWTAATGGAISYSSPTVANGVVYVGSEDHKLYAFKAKGCGQPTCSPLWTASTGGAITSSPAVVNGMVYVGSYDGKVYAFDLK